MVGDRDMIPFRGDEALLTTLASRRVKDLGAKSTQLSSRVDGVTLSIVGILVKKDDSGTTMSVDKTSMSYQRKVNNGGLPNSSDISLVEVQGRDDTDIRTFHATIGSTINERA